MIRGVAAILVAGLLLSACGSISASKAMNTWVAQTGYLKNMKQLVEVASHADTALKDSGVSTNGLHTVCGVLEQETEQVNSSLPTPDIPTTNLIAKAYNTLGKGASLCYDAGASPVKRARAAAVLVKAVGLLAEATARVVSATTP